MNRPPNYTESSYFIHQRYEDTALVIFQQLQKKKDSSNHSSQQPYTPPPAASSSPSKGKGKIPHPEASFYDNLNHSPTKTRTGAPISGQTSPLDKGAAQNFDSPALMPVPSFQPAATENFSPWVKSHVADGPLSHRRYGEYEEDRLYSKTKVGGRNPRKDSEHHRNIDRHQSESAEGVSHEDNGVEFGHFGSHGVIARRAVEISKSDMSRTKSRICVTM